MKDFIRKRLFPIPYPLSPGFSLIELLTVIGIFAVIGTLAVSIVTLTLRGTKKSELFGLMRDNGNLALVQITRNIRYAKSLEDPSSCVPSVDVQAITTLSADGSETEYSCTDTSLTANGSPLIDENLVRMTECSFTCSQHTINDPPMITLQFSLVSQRANQFVENNVPVPFQSTVMMRNYENK